MAVSWLWTTEELMPCEMNRIENYFPTWFQCQIVSCGYHIKNLDTYYPAYPMQNRFKTAFFP